MREPQKATAPLDVVSGTEVNLELQCERSSSLSGMFPSEVIGVDCSRNSRTDPAGLSDELVELASSDRSRLDQQ
jgi:hypothetical protein